MNIKYKFCEKPISRRNKQFVEYVENEKIKSLQ